MGWIQMLSLIPTLLQCALYVLGCIALVVYIRKNTNR